MVIIHRIDDFLISLFPKAKDSTNSLQVLIDEFEKYYTLGANRPKVEMKSYWFQIEINVKIIAKEHSEYKKAVKLFGKRNFKKAKSILQSLVAKNRTNSEYHRILGKIALIKGDQDTALNHLNDALRWDPENEIALGLVGTIYSNYKRDYDTAKRYNVRAESLLSNQDEILKPDNDEEKNRLLELCDSKNNQDIYLYEKYNAVNQIINFLKIVLPSITCDVSQESIGELNRINRVVFKDNSKEKQVWDAYTNAIETPDLPDCIEPYRNKLKHKLLMIFPTVFTNKHDKQKIKSPPINNLSIEQEGMLTTLISIPILKPLIIALNVHGISVDSNLQIAQTDLEVVIISQGIYLVTKMSKVEKEYKEYIDVRIPLDRKIADIKSDIIKIYKRVNKEYMQRKKPHKNTIEESKKETASQMSNTFHLINGWKDYRKTLDQPIVLANLYDSIARYEMTQSKKWNHFEDDKRKNMEAINAIKKKVRDEGKLLGVDEIQKLKDKCKELQKEQNLREEAFEEELNRKKGRIKSWYYAYSK